MKLLFMLLALSFGILDAAETRFFKGISSDPLWPHRYTLVVRDDAVTVHVEQQMGDNGEWISWGDSVKTSKITDKTIEFNCPWGVIGKALQVGCVLKFSGIEDKGFDAVLTVESFQSDNHKSVRFSRITKAQLAPTLGAMLENQEKQDPQPKR